MRPCGDPGSKHPPVPSKKNAPKFTPIHGINAPVTVFHAPVTVEGVSKTRPMKRRVSPDIVQLGDHFVHLGVQPEVCPSQRVVQDFGLAETM